MYYILQGKTPIQVPLDRFVEKFLGLPVAADQIGDSLVSTVFLGIDGNTSGNGPPILFETMILGGEHDGYRERHSTWAEAEAGHKIAIELVTRHLN